MENKKSKAAVFLILTIALTTLASFIAHSETQAYLFDVFLDFSVNSGNNSNIEISLLNSPSGSSNPINFKFNIIAQ